jgi:hypothetical protein
LSVSQSESFGGPVLSVRTEVPGRRSDEAHTVLIRTPVGGSIVAVGSIQWSWALDSYGAHVDADNRETKLDPRVQALTRNMLRALRGPA